MFGDVISKFNSVQEFSETFYKISLNEEALFSQLGQQIYVISKITDGKFKNVNKALRYFEYGMFVLLGTVMYCILLFLI